ncbi:zinc-binding alcohol dehydrogenase family protein [Streptomyces cyaneofuscatus]|uniref:quinone oxidoreductase family protein n=1 Tax=Streptomyces cyaneofuscatus TaxID=66883 RepID=UPI00369F6498
MRSRPGARHDRRRRRIRRTRRRTGRSAHPRAGGPGHGGGRRALPARCHRRGPDPGGPRAPRDRVLVQAAVGAVGTILVQLLKRRGATVIGTAGGGQKLTLVKEPGADHTVDHALPDWADRVREVAGGGVDIVLDHIGGTLGREALGLLVSETGRQVVFGFSGGAPLDVKPLELLSRNLTLTGFSARALRSRPDQARELVTGILDLAVEGAIRPVVGQTFPLEEAAAAHAAVEARTTVGKTLLIP